MQRTRNCFFFPFAEEMHLAISSQLFLMEAKSYHIIRQYFIYLNPCSFLKQQYPSFHPSFSFFWNLWLGSTNSKIIFLWIITCRKSNYTFFSPLFWCAKIMFWQLSTLLIKPEIHDNMSEIHYQAKSVVNFAANHHKVILLFSLVLL